MMIKYNFDEFSKPTKNDWLNKLNQDLGLEVAQRILKWQCEQNLELSAYYDREDIGKILPTPRRSNPEWKYIQSVKPTDNKDTILDALMNGADGLLLEDSNIDKLDSLLEQVDPDYCIMALCTNNVNLYSDFIEWWKKSHKTSEKGEVLVFDSSNSLENSKASDDLEFLKAAFKLSAQNGHKVLSINSAVVQQQGASVVLELAYMLSQAVYKINYLLDSGMSFSSISNSLFVSTAVGSSYFLELSKIRTIRILMNQLLNQYEKGKYNIPIHATTSSLYKSSIDSNTNFLRCTSEAMSAVLGGVDYLSIEPHHDLKSTDRIARNISNLLKDESYLGKVQDPSAGSYYLERLTQKLAHDAWRMFQDLESKGGYETAIDNGFFDKEMKKELEFKKENLNSGKRKMVGVNDFGNPDESLNSNHLGKNYKSLSEEFEVSRKAVESFVDAGNKRPIVYLTAIGSNAKMINARYTFVTNFFNWAGFDVIKNCKPSEMLDHSIVVCCGADEDYTSENLKVTLDGLGNSIEVIAAGKAHEKSPQKISGWINVKSDRLKSVENVLSQLGIRKNSITS